MKPKRTRRKRTPEQRAQMSVTSANNWLRPEFREAYYKGVKKWQEEMTPEERARRNALHEKPGPNAGPKARKFTDEQVRAIRSRLAAGDTQKDIAAEYGVSRVLISLIHTGKTYKRVI